jgi:hypothetical protein
MLIMALSTVIVGLVRSVAVIGCAGKAEEVRDLTGVGRRRFELAGVTTGNKIPEIFSRIALAPSHRTSRRKVAFSTLDD